MRGSFCIFINFNKEDVVLSKMQMDNIKSAVDLMNLEQLFEIRNQVQEAARHTMQNIYTQPSEPTFRAPTQSPGMGYEDYEGYEGGENPPLPQSLGNTHPGYEITVAPNETKEL